MLPCLFHHPSKAWWWDPSRIFLSVNFKFTLDRKTATPSPNTWPFRAHLPGHSSWETIRRPTCWNLLREIFALPSDRNRTGLESTLTPPWKRAGPERIFSCQWCGELSSLANYEGLNVCATSPQIPDSYVETLTPNMMILCGGPWERIRFRWDHECEALTMEVVPWSEETRELALSFSAVWECSKRIATCQPGRGPHQEPDHAGAVSLDFQAPELWSELRAE